MGKSLIAARISPSSSVEKASKNTDYCYSKTRTRDMGGEASTHEFTRAILNKLETL